MSALRCPCGEVIGEWHGDNDPHDDPNVILRCYACATTEEAERITREAAADDKRRAS